MIYGIRCPDTPRKKRISPPQHILFVDRKEVMQHPLPQPNFRLDVNGLRAWAVVAVILFHFEVWGFSGGFVGVDIFFVISGFLMTGIITEKLDKKTFSILDFYIARGKRIIPALAVMCAVLLAAGWLFIQAADYKQLASHILYSLLFLSNIEYLQESGYFDSASHEKWLLHTWSLSVEWQFYLLLPIVVGLMWRFWPGRGRLLVALVAATAVSLGMCVVMTKSNPAAAFFVLSYRAWEMLAGGIIFLSSGRLVLSGASRRLLHYAGLFLIVVSIALFDSDSAWPGMNAVLPVVAASILVLANHSSFWTGNRAAQWLGDRSYSLYLWHWPIYVALVFSEFRSNPLAIVAGLALTLLLGHVSFILIEQRSKAWLGKANSIKSARSIALLMLIAALPATFVWRTQGWPGRFAPAIESVAREAGNSNKRRLECHTQIGTKPSGCHYGVGNDKAIVLGDSHADAVVTAVSAALGDLGIKIEQVSYSGCPFVKGLQLSEATVADRPKEYQCTRFVDEVRKTLSSLDASVPVIIVNRYAFAVFGNVGSSNAEARPQAFFSKEYAQPTKEFIAEFSEAIVATACELSAHRPVYLMRPIPEMHSHVPRTLSRRLALGVTGDVSISMADYRKRNDWVWKAQDKARAQCNIEILDPTQFLCRDGRCYGSMDEKPLYYDDNHLSEYGNKMLVPMYRAAFKRKQG